MTATRSKYWVTEPDQATDISQRMNSFTYGNKPAKTVIQVFMDTIQKHGNRPALLAKIPVNVSRKE